MFNVFVYKTMPRKPLDQCRSILDEAGSKESKDKIRSKCSQYLDRAEELKRITRDRKNKKEKYVHIWCRIKLK